MTIAIFSHPDCALHYAGDAHPESPERVNVIQAALKRYPFKSEINFYEAPLATPIDLAIADLQVVKDELHDMNKRMEILEGRARTTANSELTYLDMRDMKQRMALLEGRVAKIELILSPQITKETP